MQPDRPTTQHRSHHGPCTPSGLEKEETPCEFMRSIDQISRYYVVKFVPFELLRTQDYGGGALC